jgi:hypothetical protein
MQFLAMQKLAVREREKKEILKHNNETHLGSHSLPIDQEHKNR